MNEAEITFDRLASAEQYHGLHALHGSNSGTPCGGLGFTEEINVHDSHSVVVGNNQTGDYGTMENHQL